MFVPCIVLGTLLFIVVLLYFRNKFEHFKVEQYPILYGNAITVNINSCVNIYEPITQRKLFFYNMSVIKTGNGYRGIIRGSTWNYCSKKDNKHPAISYPFVINLDNSGNLTSLLHIPITYGQFLECKDYCGIEDPKIFIYGGKEWVIGTCLGHKNQYDACTNSMCIFLLSDPDNTFKILKLPKNFDQSRDQKNWSPFEYNKILYVEYSLQPHVILQVNTNTGETIYAFKTESQNASISYGSPEINKPLTIDDKALRGGNQPILIDNHYLGIGHFKTEKLEYYHFFYMFDAKPPFAIKSISKKFKLDGQEKIHFAGGLSLQNNIIYVSYGVDDCFNRISCYTIQSVLRLFSIDRY